MTVSMQASPMQARRTVFARLNLAVLSLALLVGLSGCQSLGKIFRSKDNVAKPTELSDISNRVSMERVWSVGVGKGGKRTGARYAPAVLGAKVFTASGSGRVTGLNLANGSSLWSTDLKLRVGAGPGASADLVVVGTLDGEVVALDANSGSERWRAQVSSEVLAAPAVDGELVVVRSIDGRVFAFDAGAGTRRWVFDRSTPLLTLRGTSTPVFAEGSVLVGFDSGNVVSLDRRNGSPRWDHGVVIAEGRSELERLTDLDGVVLRAGNDVFVSSYQGKTTALDLASGNPVWTRDVGSYTGPGLDARKLIIADNQSRVHGLDAATGGSLWTQEALLNRLLTAPAVLGNRIVIGDLEGYLHVLNAEDGALVGRARPGRAAIVSAPVQAADLLLVQDSAGNLSAWRVGPL